MADCFRGDVSGYDRRRGLVVIKPQEVDYGSLTPDSYLVISTQTGQVVEGVGTPALGFSIHMALFRDLPDIRSVVAAHSKYATMWAQAGRPIPCLGVAHADYFCGEIPITPPWTEKADEEEYYRKVAEQIVEHYEETGVDPNSVPAILVDRFGVVSWAAGPVDAARNISYIELLAELAYGTLCLNPKRPSLSDSEVRRHFSAGKILPYTGDFRGLRREGP